MRRERVVEILMAQRRNCLKMGQKRYRSVWKKTKGTVANASPGLMLCDLLLLQENRRVLPLRLKSGSLTDV
ncbi:hypothetical protein OIU79_016102 [Salix purpurea]|uniref:Uncharacterized protein n=1 Tax=Salix purpurea TaxID=77065 RepID=A0A9Q0PDG8_SALPP|nr:hypothetical protein OIU79_016102 [Salix purpurea]